MARPKVLRYELYDIITDQLVFAGTERECADFVGTKPGRIRDAYCHTRKGIYKNYRIVDVTGNSEYVCMSDRDRDAIENWDKFTKPLRKEFGIPVYRPGKDGAR